MQKGASAVAGAALGREVEGVAVLAVALFPLGETGLGWQCSESRQLFHGGNRGSLGITDELKDRHNG